MSNETMAKLKLPNIAGVKDATCDSAPIEQPSRMRGRVVQLSGEDATTAFLGQGGDGCISVTSNVAPACSKCMKLAGPRSGRLRGAAGPLTAADALFCETSPHR